MGVDIHGWVEMKVLDEWDGVLRLEAFVGRHRHGFGSMFLDGGLFPPIAKGRGLPNDISEEAKLSYPEEDWGHSWIYWNEIDEIDWEEVSLSDPSICRRDTLHQGWDIVFKAMSFMAKKAEKDQVRLVVWFNG